MVTVDIFGLLNMNEGQAGMSHYRPRPGMELPDWMFVNFCLLGGYSVLLDHLGREVRLFSDPFIQFVQATAATVSVILL